MQFGRGDINKQKLNPGLIRQISERLLSMNDDVPLDFVRKPRSLDELARLKATEFRLFFIVYWTYCYSFYSS